MDKQKLSVLIILAYENYLRNLRNFKSTKSTDNIWFSASKAGGCYRKHIYKSIGQEPIPIEEVPGGQLRRWRLGELLHEDLQKALNNQINGHIVLSEFYCEDPSNNTRGYSDILLVPIRKGELVILDIKTIGSYQWKKAFGYKKNRDPNPSFRYELQLATYCLHLEKAFDRKITNMFILYINIDTGRHKLIEVEEKFKIEAQEYWNDVNKIVKNETLKTMEPGKSIGVPFANWECKYCEYRHACTSPYIS